MPLRPARPGSRIGVPRLTRVVLLPFVVVLLLLVGCDADGPGRAMSDSPGGSAVPAPDASPSTEPPGPCYDADCEVTVQVGDELSIDPGLGLTTVTVAELVSGEITVELRGSGIETGMSVTGNGGGGSSCDATGCVSRVRFTPDGAVETGGIRITVSDIDADRATLRIAQA